MMYDELTIAFAMRMDDQAMTYEQGLLAAEALADEFVQAAEDRKSYVDHEVSQ